MIQAKKLIQVALPLEAINDESLRESYIYKAKPSSLHKWWAQRPLAAARAVIFASLVDDPNSSLAPKAFVDACSQLPKGKNASLNDTPRQRLFDFIERLIIWENATSDEILESARNLISLSTGGDLPSIYDPFAGGGTIPLEGQRLGLRAIASDLNPIATLINKALIEIPPKFSGNDPVNPLDRSRLGSQSWINSTGLSADINYYGNWVLQKAQQELDHIYPKMDNGEMILGWIWARSVKCPIRVKLRHGQNTKSIKQGEVSARFQNIMNRLQHLLSAKRMTDTLKFKNIIKSLACCGNVMKVSTNDCRVVKRFEFLTTLLHM